MREIYSGSWAVIAWIGWSPPSAAINHAFQFLRILASLQGDQRNLGKFQTESGEPSRGTYFCALNELMRQEYWFRLWIIQELIMGASSTVLLGDKFEVVGEAYVQGFMDGEALVLMESEACDIQPFIFR
jgi:hypothetical protein